MTAQDDETYNIPIDQTFSMVYAFLPGVTQVDYHENNRGAFYITLYSSGGCSIGSEPIAIKYPKATLHGVLMWFAWSVIGLA